MLIVLPSCHAFGLPVCLSHSVQQFLSVCLNPYEGSTALLCCCLPSGLWHTAGSRARVQKLRCKAHNVVEHKALFLVCFTSRTLSLKPVYLSARRTGMQAVFRGGRLNTDISCVINNMACDYFSFHNKINSGIKMYLSFCLYRAVTTIAMQCTFSINLNHSLSAVFFFPQVI